MFLLITDQSLMCNLNLKVRSSDYLIQTVTHNFWRVNSFPGCCCPRFYQYSYSKVSFTLEQRTLNKKLRLKISKYLHFAVKSIKVCTDRAQFLSVSPTYITSFESSVPYSDKDQSLHRDDSISRLFISFLSSYAGTVWFFYIFNLTWKNPLHG